MVVYNVTNNFTPKFIHLNQLLYHTEHCEFLPFSERKLKQKISFDMMLATVIVIAVIMPASIAGLAVTGKRCGTKVCDLLEYCSNFNNHCESCANICEESSHNFDLNLCADQCQGN